MAAMPTEPPTTTSAPTSPGHGRRLIVASLGPAVFLGLSWMLAPTLARGEAECGLLRAGGMLGSAIAAALCLALGAWMIRACRRGGSAFLLPMAGGFLLKLFVLAAGTWLLYQPLRDLGSHVAFAVCFVASALAFQLIFTPVLGRARLQPRSSNSPVVH